MGHFAEINSQNIVQRVLVVPDSQDSRGNDFLSVDLGLGGTWIQTSYNTGCGTHILGGTPLRKNYAGFGYTYDVTRDAFIAPKPFNAWLLDENTCCWYPPTPHPMDGKQYYWSDDTNSWLEMPL
jgi:hypothetical protein